VVDLGKAGKNLWKLNKLQEGHVIFPGEYTLERD
jgi:hypothetical protein